MNLQTVCVLMCALVCTYAQGQKKIFCYYGSDSQFRASTARFKPHNIDPTLCTHIIFTFVKVTNNAFQAQNWNDDGANGLYQQTINLKSENPSLKVLLAVGGWVANYEPFKVAMFDEARMTQFANNAALFLRRLGFDGLDMDWEFPGTRDSPPEDREKFTTFMQIIQETFRRESQRTGKEKMLLTLAAAVGESFIKMSYESHKIHEHVDYMLLMTYNFHGGWSEATAHHSTLLPNSFDTGEDRYLCQAWAVNYWINQGVPKNKIILGLATYGMSFTLQDPNNAGVNAPITGGGRKGRYTGQEGILAYYEICENIKSGGWKSFWLEDQEVPYATRGDQWVGYDTPNSLRIKVEKLINAYELAGAFIWSVDLDDFNGSCGEGKYPLLRAINQALQAPSKTLPIKETGSSIYPSSLCAREQFSERQDKDNCHKFSICVRTGNEWSQYFLECFEGLSFDIVSKTCIEKFDCL